LSALENLIGNLTADDPAIRLHAVMTLYDRKNDPGLAEKIRTAAAVEVDPTLKLYLKWLSDSEQPTIAASVEAIVALLNQAEIDWVNFFFCLHRVDRHTAAKILPQLRKLSLQQIPASLQPMLVQFFQKYGTVEDIERLSEWCADKNPVILSLAIEGLSRIQPDCLRRLLLPLLSNESPGIRSRAIRLLYRWHPDEAPRHLAAMLTSDMQEERRAALANAYFLPFDLVKLDILRFMIREESPVLLLQAGNLLIINPDQEVATALASIAVTTSAEKAPIIRQTLARLAEFMAKTGMITTTSEEETAMLVKAAAERQRSRAGQSEPPDNQIAELRKLATENPAKAGELLKNSFNTRLSEPVLLAMVELLTGLEPEFLRPFLPELLRSGSLQVQIAALTALARISPVQAERLLEQYTASASNKRRQTGIHVLSRMEKAFALPILTRAFARETDPEVLDFFADRLPASLDRANLVGLLRESAANPETHNLRRPVLERICRQNNLNPADIEPQHSPDPDLTLENVMIARACRPEIASEAIIPASDPESENQFRQKTAIAKIALLLQPDAAPGHDVNLINKLLTSEKNQFVRFLLESHLRRHEFTESEKSAPVVILQKNFVKPHPDWHEIAAGLLAIPERTARLAAPMFQNRNWAAWRSEILPVMLDFVARTGLAMFTPQVAALLKNQNLEVRFSAMRCLEKINPEELLDALPEIENDKTPEVRAFIADFRVSTRQWPGESDKAQTFFSDLMRRYRRRQKSVLLRFAAVVAAMAVLLLMVLNPRRPETETLQIPPSGQPLRTMQRFAEFRQPPTQGQERLIFGRIEKVRSDSLLVLSPTLGKKILIRFKSPPGKKENEHFNGRVRIETSGGETIEASLLENPQQKN